MMGYVDANKHIKSIEMHSASGCLTAYSTCSTFPGLKDGSGPSPLHPSLWPSRGRSYVGSNILFYLKLKY